MTPQVRGFPMLRLKMAATLGAALFAAASAVPAAAQESRFSLRDFAGSFVTVQAQYGANIISATLESGLKRSRDTARADSHPIPDEVREALIPFYSPELLENVRYSIGDTSPAGLAGFAIRNGNAAAVTLIDTVVFKDESHIRNIALWAHEIHHVEQYEEWGVAGFASRYAFNWQDVEAEAQTRAQEFVAWYKARVDRNQTGQN
jgi:hypothetical protein